MFLCASDESQRFSSDCVHQKMVQLFRTELHLRSELQAVSLLKNRGFEMGHGITSKMHDHSEIHLSARCRRRDCSSLGFRRQSLSLFELLVHFCQCLGQLLHHCHVRSARKFNTMDDQRSATMLQ